MRKLYVVPIIHSNADLGSLALEIDKIGKSMLGVDFWQIHKEIVEGFWNSVTCFFESLTEAGLKLYQDGLIADGEMGMRIVKTGVKDGSRNYQLIACLLEKGAKLVQTEDFALVKREYDLISKVVKAKSETEKVTASIEFQLSAKQLLKDRDRYIAQKIEQTLGDSEIGILFIGAYHDVVSLLSPDIVGKEVKETQKVREYHTLLTDLKRNDDRLKELGAYLVAPVNMN